MSTDNLLNAKVETGVAVIQVEVLLNKLTYDWLSEEDRQLVKSKVQHYVSCMLTDLHIPAQEVLTFGFKEEMDASMQIKINDAVCRLPALNQQKPEASGEALALAIMNGVFKNRGLLIHSELAYSIRGLWFPENELNFLSGLSKAGFYAYLRLLVQNCFRIDYCRQMSATDKPSLPDSSAESYFEQTIRSLKRLKAVLYKKEFSENRQEEEKELSDLLNRLQDDIFYDLGVRCPKVAVCLNPELNSNEWQLQVNDLKLPPFKGIEEDEWFADKTVSELKALGIKDAGKIYSELGRECAVIKKSEEAKNLIEQEGIYIWDALAYGVFLAKRKILAHAGFFINRESLEIEFEKLRQGFPALIEAISNRFNIDQVVQVVRLLVQEAVSIKDLKNVLEAMLSVKSTIQVDFDNKIVFIPFGNPLPVDKKTTIDQAQPAQLADCIRMKLKHRMSYLYTKGYSTLNVYLLDTELEKVIQGTLKQEAGSPENDLVLNAIKEKCSDPPFALVPVILTSFGVRRKLRQMIELEFPDLPVLCYQELIQEINIQPLDRISIA